MTFSRIGGTGRYLPERVLTNADMEKIVDTTDEWIRTRTGIEERHVATDDEQTSDLCVDAAKIAMADAGVDPQDIDLIILYRRPLLDYWCETQEDFADLVRHVLIHEIGHHFGFSDEEMERIEAAAERPLL